jgi:hypothetical protein
MKSTQSLDKMTYIPHCLPGVTETWLPCFGAQGRVCCSNGIDSSEYPSLSRCLGADFSNGGERVYHSSLSTAPVAHIEEPGQPAMDNLVALVASGYCYDVVTHVSHKYRILHNGRLHLPDFWLDLALQLQLPAMITDTAEKNHVLGPEQEWCKAPLEFWRSLVGNRALHPHGDCATKMPDSWLGVLSCEATWPEHPEDEWELVRETLRHVSDRSSLILTSRTLGFFRKNAQVGDKICILLGCSEPVILRPRGKGTEGYYVVGSGYIDGIMDGEFLQQCLELETPVQEFNLK